MEILTAVLILRLWTGFVSVHPETGWSPGLVVIRTQAEYDRFTSLIPQHRLQKRQPAPASTDPLLGHPHVDLTTRMIIVVTSRSAVTGVKILSIERGSTEVIVRVHFTSPANAHDIQQPLFYGQYAAAEVERIDGEVRLIEIKE